METSIKCKTFTNTKLWILYNMLNAVYQIGDWSCKFSLKNDSPLAMETSLEHWIILTLNMTNGYHKKGSRKIFLKLKIQCPTHVEKILVKRRGSWLLVLFVCGFFFSAATTSCSDFCWKWSKLSWIFNKCGQHTWAPNTYLLHSYQIWQRSGFQGCIWPSWWIIYSITCR